MDGSAANTVFAAEYRFGRLTGTLFGFDYELIGRSKAQKMAVDGRIVWPIGGDYHVFWRVGNYGWSTASVAIFGHRVRDVSRACNNRHAYRSSSSICAMQNDGNQAKNIRFVCGHAK